MQLVGTYVQEELVQKRNKAEEFYKKAYDLGQMCLYAEDVQYLRLVINYALFCFDNDKYEYSLHLLSTHLNIINSILPELSLAQKEQILPFIHIMEQNYVGSSSLS